MTDEIMEEAKEIKRVEIQVTHNEKLFGLVMPENTSIGEAYEGCFALLSRVLEIAHEAAEKARPKKVE